jgi:hypothetical protein
MATDDIVEAAKAEIRRQVWGSQRGKATRTYIRENPEIINEFEETKTILDRTFPAHVTRASVLLELNMRARRKEASTEAKRWAAEHPQETAEMRKKIQQEFNESKEMG